jgi:hypothetical protein
VSEKRGHTLQSHTGAKVFAYTELAGVLLTSTHQPALQLPLPFFFGLLFQQGAAQQQTSCAVLSPAALCCALPYSSLL